MPFEGKLADKIALRARYCCEICRKPVYAEKNSLAHAHSSSTLHTVAVSKTHCVVTNTPDRYVRMMGKLLPKKAFKAYSLGKENDGYCLCHACHRLVHEIALNDTKLLIPGFTGHHSIPSVLDAVTFYFYRQGHF